MIYNFTLTAGGKQGERDAENRGEYMSSVFLSASKFLNGFQTLIIFHSVTAITCRGEKNEGDGECLACGWVEGLGEMVLADAAFA